MFLLPVLSVVLTIVNGNPISSTFDVAPRLLNGIHAQPGQFPSAVRLHIFYKSKHGTGTCGGHILNERWILSVAHCLVPNNNTKADKVDVYPGVTKVAEQGQPIEAEEIIPHPDYKLIMNDIALIKLKKPLTWSSRVKPMAKFAKTHINEELTTVGYGIGSKDHLSWMKMKTRSCTYLTEQYVCVKRMNAKSKICKGDSGSPLINENHELVGLVSHGDSSEVEESFVCGKAVYYTKPLFYLDWIKKVTKIQNIIVS